MSHIQSFEQSQRNNNKALESAPEMFTIAETNAMQVDLMKKYDGDPAIWIETYSQAFRDLIKNDLSLHDLYIHDPEVCLAYIKKCLENPVHH